MGFNLVSGIWTFENAIIISHNINSNDIVYPNPTNGLLKF